MNKQIIIKLLESILTIDGKGRNEKARRLLALMKEAPADEFIAALKEIGERKW